jgi:hypothetical protein
MEDIAQISKEQLYRAAVGKSGEAYYVPKFLEFDNSESRRSWNLAALIFGVLWFLYRRMFVSALVLGLLAPALFYWLSGIAIQLVLQAPPQSWLWHFPALVFNWVLIPVYANYLYFSSVEKRIASLRERLPDDAAVLESLSGSRHTSIVACVVGPLLVVGVVILAARSGESGEGEEQVSATIAALAELQSSVVKNYIATRKWPEHASKLGIQEPIRSAFIDRVDIDRGTISVRFGNQASPLIAGYLFSLRPSLASTGAVLWSCGYASQKGQDSPSGPAGVEMTNLPKRFLPWKCR